MDMNGDENFLSRWSRLKRDARHAPADAPPVEPVAPAPTQAATPAAEPPAEPAPLPPIETLTPQSDFTPFMKPDVDVSLRRQALKALFQDPRFNVMDGLDVYIDDYSKPDPLPEGWLEKMTQMARLGAYEPPAEETPSAGAGPQSAEPIPSGPAPQGDDAPPPSASNEEAEPSPPSGNSKSETG
jgi:uncharacterized protein DUF3306